MGSNQRPSDQKPSTLPLDYGARPGSFDWDEPFRRLGRHELPHIRGGKQTRTMIETTTTASHRAETPEPWISPTNASSSPAAALRGIHDQIDESMTPVDSTTLRTPSHFHERKRAQLHDWTVFERETISFYDPQPVKMYKSRSVQTYVTILKIETLWLHQTLCDYSIYIRDYYVILCVCQWYTCTCAGIKISRFARCCFPLFHWQVAEISSAQWMWQT